MLNEPSAAARDSEAVPHGIADYRLVPRRKQFANGVLKGPHIVTGPSADVGCQGAYLCIPDVNRCIIGTDKENIYITFLGHGATSRRSKYCRVLWSQVPIFEILFDLQEEHLSKMGKLDDRAGG